MAHLQYAYVWKVQHLLIKKCIQKESQPIIVAALKKYASVPRSKIRQLTGILFTRIVCITHFSHAFTPWGPYIYAINIYIFIFLKPNNDNSFIIPLWIMQNCTRYQDIFQIQFFFFLKPNVNSFSVSHIQSCRFSKLNQFWMFLFFLQVW